MLFGFQSGNCRNSFSPNWFRSDTGWLWARIQRNDQKYILSCFQVYRQQESASSGLEQLRQQSSRQEDAVAKVSKEKEFLVHEKAALEVRLAAVERDRQGLSEQLAEAR